MFKGIISTIKLLQYPQEYVNKDIGNPAQAKVCRIEHQGLSTAKHLQDAKTRNEHNLGTNTYFGYRARYVNENMRLFFPRFGKSGGISR